MKLELLNRFIKDMQIRNLNEKTIRAYHDNIINFYKDLNINEDSLATLTIDDFYNYIETLKKSFAVSTINQKIATLQSFYKFLYKNDYIDKNVPKGITKITIEKKAPVYLELEEARELIRIVKTNCDENHSTISLRDRLIIELFLDTGVRVFEMENLKISNINFSTGETLIIGKRGKRRYVRISSNVRNLIQQWLEERNNWYIKDEFKNYLITSSTNGENLKVRRLQYIVDKYINKANIGLKKVSECEYAKVTTHKLRHTFATTMLGTGTLSVKQVQDRLGHESLETTMIYAHSLKNEENDNPLFA